MQRERHLALGDVDDLGAMQESVRDDIENLSGLGAQHAREVRLPGRRSALRCCRSTASAIHRRRVMPSAYVDAATRVLRRTPHEHWLKHLRERIMCVP